MIQHFNGIVNELFASSARLVSAPEVFIVDEFEQPIVDKYYEVDSTIELTCIVRHVSMLSSTVNWLHGKKLLNDDMTRGGIR